MTDMNEKLRERWNDRRKKGTNWTKLIIMVLILVALLLAMHWLGKAGQIQSDNRVETIDSSAVQVIPPSDRAAPIAPDAIPGAAR